MCHSLHAVFSLCTLTLYYDSKADERAERKDVSYHVVVLAVLAVRFVFTPGPAVHTIHTVRTSFVQ